MWNFWRDGDEEQQDYLPEETEGLCSLSPVQRIYGFAACLLAGLVLLFLSLIVFAKPIKFALLFTFGNMLAVGSTALLIGPGQQLRMMFDNVRVYATAIYVGSMIVALVCALLIHSKVFTIIAFICEMCALIWAARCSISILFVLNNFCPSSMDLLPIQEMALLSSGKFQFIFTFNFDCLSMFAVPIKFSYPSFAIDIFYSYGNIFDCSWLNSALFDCSWLNSGGILFSLAQFWLHCLIIPVEQYSADAYLWTSSRGRCDGH